MAKGIVSEDERQQAYLEALEQVQNTRREVVPGVTVVLELGQQMSVAIADPFALREQDMNARMMTPEMEARFKQNVKRRGLPESLPYCALQGEGERRRVEIISGHHRTRVARAIELKAFAILLDESGLTRSQIVAKQLAHNAISGFDDPDTLRALVGRIENVDDLLESAIGELEPLPQPDTKNPFLQPALRFDWQAVTFAFLPHQMTDFRAVLEHIEQNHTKFVATAPIASFEPFVKALNAFGRTAEVKNSSAALALLIQTALQQIEEMGGDPASRQPEQDPAHAEDAEDAEAGTVHSERWVSVAQTIGRASIPDGSAKIIKMALDRAEERGDVGPANRWQMIEWLCASYLAEGDGA